MISTEQIEFAQKLEGIFMPYASARRLDFIKRNGRFVHYTTASAGLEIIRSKRMWMRNTTCMSDYSEVQHGFRTLNKFFLDAANKANFVQACDECIQGVADEGITLFNQWWNDTQFQTYISSISEHDNDEDAHGRLSMWRAFGRSSARVALVFRVPLASGAAAMLNIMLSPVAYFTDAQLHAEMQQVIASIRANQDFLRTLTRPQILAMIFFMLLAGVVCLKHEGFREEREWRVTYSPKRNPSSMIDSAVEVIDGVPQIVHKLPLDARVSADVAALDVATLCDRVIIGPSPYPWAMYEAFVATLTDAGVADATSRVFVSGIPIRT